MATPKKTKKNERVEIDLVKTKTVEFCLMNRPGSGMVMNAMPTHGLHEFLYPKKKVPGARREGLKHDPLVEFRQSMHYALKGMRHTLLVTPAPAWKYSIAGAAVDMDGASMAQMKRICWINGTKVPVWGIPKPFMAMVRMAGINHTPDVRTRAVLPEWATTVSVTYITNKINTKGVANLLAAAGLLQGIGDWRPQKGGSYGMYQLVEPSNKEFKRIMKTQGRIAQEKAIKNPEWYDSESEELFRWFVEEAAERGDTVTTK